MLSFRNIHFIHSLAILFVILYSGLAIAENFEYQCGTKYTMFLDIPDEKNGDDSLFRIYKNKNLVFTLQEYGLGLEKNYCDIDFLGNGSPVFVLSSWSGGAHCCRTYYFIELNDTVRMLQKIEAWDSYIEFIPQQNGKPYRLSLLDVTFKNFHTSFAYSVMPRVFLKFDGNRVVFDSEAMLHRINEDVFIKNLSELEAQWTGDQIEDFYKFLDTVINLIYSGNADFGMKMIDAIFARHKFENLTAVRLKSDILCRIKNSEFANEIISLNKGFLKIPRTCKDIGMCTNLNCE